MKLDGSVALVTGANRGLGACFVEALLAAGAAKVYAGARRPETLAPLVAAHGAKVVPLRLDVTRDADVREAAAAAADVSLLVNNAGALEHRALLEAGELGPLQREMAVNLFGLARMSLAFAPVLKRNGGGAIVNMLSVASLVPFGPFGSYAASKAAAMSLTHSLRWELRAQGTQVFGVYAGFIDTAMLNDFGVDKTPPAAIARAALDGVARDVLDIDADERARNVRRMLKSDAAALERDTWERADGFRSRFPVGR